MLIYNNCVFLSYNNPNNPWEYIYQHLLSKVYIFHNYIDSLGHWVSSSNAVPSHLPTQAAVSGSGLATARDAGLGGRWRYRGVGDSMYHQKYESIDGWFNHIYSICLIRFNRNGWFICLTLIFRIHIVWFCLITYHIVTDRWEGDLLFRVLDIEFMRCWS